ncbi:MAG: DUF2283 domain-containing protein [Methanobacteriaceae archaeon]|jgi:uncharacterized protein YuzE|nr:DUF2283 domain-containing protein [Methanobacteriaceae archaeon]
MENKKSKNLSMKMDYDLQNDSLFLYRKDQTIYKESVEIGEDLILDFNEELEPMSFEILNISKLLGVKKFSVKNLMKITGGIGINKDCISVNLGFTVPVHQKKIEKPVYLVAPNDINLPSLTTNLGLAEV